MLRRALSRAWGTLRRRRQDEDFDEEVRLHLEMLEERFVGQGMSREEAVYAARRQFGGVARARQDRRETQAFALVGRVVQDFRHALRQLRRARGFTVSAAATLAAGIGASTAVFAALDAVVLRPLPYASPDRLMAFRSIDRRGTPHPTLLSYPNFFDFRARNRVFERLVAYRDARFTLSSSMPAIQVAGAIVSWDVFPLLGTRPALGRGFRPEEEAAGTHVVVLAHPLWKSRFGGDPGILGRPIRVDGRPFTVVGVAPPGFSFPEDQPGVELWTTIAEDATGEFEPLTEQRGARLLEAIGRLKAGVSPALAQAQMDVLGGALAREYPDDNQNVARTRVRPELDHLVGGGRRALWILLGAVLMVLLIGCANVANLLLACASERSREFALRAALGASRASVVRQILVESLTLGLLAAASGALVAQGLLFVILPLVGDHVPRMAGAGVDGRVLAFSAALAVATSILFSLAPALQVARADPAGVLKEGASSIAGGHHRVRSAVVIGQITLGLVLLVGAELLIVSFLHLVRRDVGFRADHLLAFELALPEAQYDPAAQVRFCDRLLERLRAVPGVRAAAAGAPLPLSGHQMSVSFDVEERPAAPPARPHCDMAIVTPGYFGTMGIPLLRGRDFSERDDAAGPPVVVVNEAFARRYFPGEEALGKRIEPGATNAREGTRKREIVGVVGNAMQEVLGTEPDPVYYFPEKQLRWGIGTIVLRTAIPPRAVESAARSVVSGLDREVPVYRVRTGEEISATAVAAPRLGMVLMGGFAAAALLLTMVGLYGMLSYAVARRRREIAVRMALGAGRREVLAMVLGQAMGLVATGLALGLVGALAGGRLLESLVYGVRPTAPLVMAGGCGILLITCIAAAYAPAARAASQDPTSVLRSE